MILPKRFHPGFSDPAQKPFGQSFEVDYGDKYGKHIIRAYVPINQYHQDLIKGPLTPNSGIIDVTKGQADFNTQWLSYSGPLESLTEMTIICRVKRNSVSQTGGIFADKTNTNWGDAEGVALWLRNITDRVLFIVGTDSAQSDPNWDVLNDTTSWWDVAATWKASDFIRLYVNGDEPSYAVQDVATSHTISTQNLMIGRYYSTSYPMKGEIRYLYVLNKALSENELRDFHAQPYRVLKPTVPFIYAPEQAAASTDTAKNLLILGVG